MKTVIFTLPLPMSVNRMYMYNPRTHQKIYKREAVEWMNDAVVDLQVQLKKHEAKLGTFHPIEVYTPIELMFYIPRSNADSHNYKKLLFDALEHAGLVENDKYILDRTMKVKVDTKNPRVIIALDTSLFKQSN